MKWQRYVIVTGSILTSLCWWAKYSASKNAQIAILKHEMASIRDHDEETIKENEVHIEVTEKGTNTLRSFSSIWWKGRSLTETEQQPEKSWITEAGIIIPFFTAVAYSLALSHEGAFCNYFHIPHDFISLSPTIVLTALLSKYALFGLVMIFILFANTMSHPVGEACTEKTRIGLYIALTFWIGCVIATPVMNQEFIPNSVLMDILIVVLTTWAIEKIRKSDFHERKKIAGLLIVVVTGFYAFRLLGAFAASTQHEFPIVTLSPEGSMPRLKGMVLRSYGEYFFAAPINCGTQQVEEKLVMVKISESAKPSLTLSMEKASFPLPTEKVHQFCKLP